MCFMISGVTPQHGQRFVVAFPCLCRIGMVGRVLLVHFLMKCDMWTVVVSRDFFHNVRSTSSQSDVWVKFWSSQCWCSRHLDILYAINWAMLECTGSPFIDKLGILCGSESPIAILFLVSDESKNAAVLCSYIASILMLRYASDVKVDAGLPLFWCP